MAAEIMKEQTPLRCVAVTATGNFCAIVTGNNSTATINNNCAACPVARAVEGLSETINRLAARIDELARENAALRLLAAQRSRRRA